MADPVINNSKGIFWALVSMFCAGSMTVAVRLAGDMVPSTEIVLHRFGFVTVILLGLGLCVPYFRARMRFSKWQSHLIRGSLIAVATHTGFYAITVIPLNTVAVLFFTAPIFATILGVIVHKESIGPRRIAAIAIGFLGAIIVCEPWTAIDPTLWMGYGTALLASLLFALALTMSRGLAEADGVFATVVSASVVATLFSIPFVLDGFTAPQNLNYLLILVVFLATTGLGRNIADVEQYHYGEASVVGPFSYLRLIVVAIGAYWFFDELPTATTLIGGAIIVGSTLYIAIRDRQTSNRSKRPSAP
ncbi:MAG: DMT family transporter [Pseudomonadota bacterium]